MIRKEPSHLFEDDLPLDEPQTDPSAADWHSFAARVSKQTAVKDPFLKTPVTSPTHSTTVRNQRPLAMKENTYSHHHHQHHHNNHHQQQDTYTKGNRTPYMNTNGLNLFSVPPLCFCQKLASRSESGEYGVIYDCHYMLGTNNENICGFHVHQQTWQRMGDLVKKKQAVDNDNPELWSCPYFNFTYCVVFRVSNQAKKASPVPPRCFCNKRTILTECDYNSKRRICFTCHNFHSDSTQGRCNWFLWAEELTFIRPKYPRHNASTTDGFGSPITADIIPQQPSTVTKDREHHSLYLLSTLNSNKLDSLKLSEYDLPASYPGSSTDNTVDGQDQESEYFGDDTQKQPIDHQQKSLDELLYGSQHSYLLPTNPELTTLNHFDNNKFIPTSVRRNISTKRLEDDSKHQNQSNDNQQSVLINTLQERGSERELQMIQLQERLLCMQQEIRDLKKMSENQRQQMQNTIDTQISLRQHCQKKLACMEEAMENLVEENKTLTLEMDSRQMISSVPKEPKCQVCFSGDVECAVVPCFHAVYCLSCAHKLKECAICRMPKFSIQKVYLC